MEDKYYIPDIEEFHIGFDFVAKPKRSEKTEYSFKKTNKTIRHSK